MLRKLSLDCVIPDLFSVSKVCRKWINAAEISFNHTQLADDGTLNVHLGRSLFWCALCSLNTVQFTIIILSFNPIILHECSWKKEKQKRWSRKWQNCLPLSVKHGSSMTYLAIMWVGSQNNNSYQGELPYHQPLLTVFHHVKCISQISLARNKKLQIHWPFFLHLQLPAKQHLSFEQERALYIWHSLGSHMHYIKALLVFHHFLLI